MKVIKKTKLLNYKKPIYDLRIKDNHNYIITKSDIIVHNSGKTYTLNKIKSGNIEPRMVNTDKWFQLYKNEWDEWNKIGSKVKILNNTQLSLYINSMLPLAIDGTGTKTSAIIKRVGVLESFGYDCAMVFVNCSIDTALKRAKTRERKVPEEYIKSVHEQMEKHKNFYRGKFSDFIQIENNIGELNDDIVIKSFKVMNNFYNRPIENPLGKEHKETLILTGEKYLTPSIYKMEEIKKAIAIWYQKD